MTILTAREISHYRIYITACISMSAKCNAYTRATDSYAAPWRLEARALAAYMSKDISLR